MITEFMKNFIVGYEVEGDWLKVRYSSGKELYIYYSDLAEALILRIMGGQIIQWDSSGMKKLVNKHRKKQWFYASFSLLIHVTTTFIMFTGSKVPMGTIPLTFATIGNIVMSFTFAGSVKELLDLHFMEEHVKEATIFIFHKIESQDMEQELEYEEDFIKELEQEKEPVQIENQRNHLEEERIKYEESLGINITREEKEKVYSKEKKH